MKFFGFLVILSAVSAMAELLEGTDLTLKCTNLDNNECFTDGNPLGSAIYISTRIALEAIRMTENPCAIPDDPTWYDGNRNLRGLVRTCGYSSGQGYMYAHYGCGRNRRELQVSCEGHEVGVRTISDLPLLDLLDGVSLSVFQHICLTDVVCELSYITDNF